MLKLAVIAKSAWKDLPSRVDGLAKSLSDKLPEKVSISLILKDYGDIPANKNGRIKAAFLDKTLDLEGYDGACLLVSLSDRKKYGLMDTLRGHYLRDEDGYLEFWVASDSRTKRKGKPQFEETFSHELLHGLYHRLGIPKTPDETKVIKGVDNTHAHHNILGNLDGAFAEIRAAWPKKKTVPAPTTKDPMSGCDPKLKLAAKRLVSAMAELGTPIRITEGFRTAERQAELYAQGRTTPGKIVTNAKPGQSNHERGTAFDIVFTKLGYDGPWDVAAMLGRSFGLKPGHYWAGFKDSPHFEL
jgi:hypothetical protein